MRYINFENFYQRFTQSQGIEYRETGAGVLKPSCFTDRCLVCCFYAVTSDWMNPHDMSQIKRYCGSPSTTRCAPSSANTLHGNLNHLTVALPASKEAVDDRVQKGKVGGNTLEVSLRQRDTECLEAERQAWEESLHQRDAECLEAEKDINAHVNRVIRGDNGTLAMPKRDKEWKRCPEGDQSKRRKITVTQRM